MDGAQRGGLRSAPTIPTPSTRRIRTEIKLARVNPCSITALRVRKAIPAMNTSARPRTSRRVTEAAGRATPSVDREAGRLGLAMHGEEADQRKAKDEAADMCEVGHATATADRVAQAGAAEVELLQEPEAEQEYGRDLDDSYEEHDEHEAEYARARVEHDVAAEHRGDRSGSAQRRRGRIGIDDHLSRQRDEPAEQVEDDESPRPHRILDVGAEDRQKEHVAG